MLSVATLLLTLFALYWLLQLGTTMSEWMLATRKRLDGLHQRLDRLERTEREQDHPW